MSSLIRPIRQAARRLLRAPGFTLVAVATLALGIGANTAIFSVVESVLLRPLPYPEPHRLVMLWEDFSRRGGEAEDWFSPGNFYDWREQNTSFTGMSAFTEWSPTLVDEEGAERLKAGLVTQGFFRVLGVDPLLGRTFAAEEDAPGQNHVAVLSYGLWQSRFGGARDIVGRTISLDGEPTNVIGVMPRGFAFPLLPGSALWSPLGVDLANGPRASIYLQVVARMKPGVTLTAARSDVRSIAARLEKDYPRANQGVGAALTPLHETLVGDLRPALLTLLGAVGLVLLIACVNLANLLLVRSASRRRERAIRTALGAGPGRLAADVLVESLVLAAAGAGAGVVLAAWLLDALVALAPVSMPAAFAPRLDSAVLVFAMALAALTGLAFGLVPALHGFRDRVTVDLKEGAAGSGLGRSGRRLRSGLVAGQVALAFALLVGAGLLLRSFLALQSVNPGFQPRGLLTFEIGLPAGEYAEGTRVNTFLNDFLTRIRALPGVGEAGMVSSVPMSGNDTDASFVIEGEPAPTPGQGKVIWYRQVDPDYFRTMRIPLIEGRGIRASDGPDAPRVAVLSETAAQRFFPGQDPVGKRFKPGSDPARDIPWWTVVGVVGSVRHAGLRAAPRAEMYISQAQAPRRSMTLVVRATRGDPLQLVAGVRAVLRDMDPHLAISRVRTQDAIIGRTIALPRFLTLCLIAFGFMALVLAGIGIYGVIAYAVGQRTREMGIRMALGAGRGDVVRLVMGQGALIIAGGLAAGLLAALGLGRAIRGLLFHVPSADVVTFIVAPLVLTGVALLAIYVPARRATRVDPLDALRTE
ncbi:MAG: ABC transporter permease [Gemmatimonadota bacterium]